MGAIFPSYLLALLFGVDPVDFGLHIFALFTFFPDRMPVLAMGVAAAVADFQKVLGRIFLLSTFPSALGLEVIEHDARIVSDVAKVDCFATLCQEEQAVKLLEENGAWLMDCAKHSLTRIC